MICWKFIWISNQLPRIIWVELWWEKFVLLKLWMRCTEQRDIKWKQLFVRFLFGDVASGFNLRSWRRPKCKFTQVKEYRTVQAGIHRKSPEHGGSIPAGNFLHFFRCIPITFLCFPSGTGRKLPEKIRPFSCWNTASMFPWFPVYFCKIQLFFHLFPAGSFGIWSPECSTWVREFSLLIMREPTR